MAWKKRRRAKKKPALEKSVTDIVKKEMKRELAAEIEENHYFSAPVGPSNIPIVFTVGTNVRDLTALSCSYTAASTFVPLRRGTRINNKGLRIRCVLNSALGATAFYVRLVVFKWDASPTGYVPTEGILFAIPNASTAGNNAHSFKTNNLESQYTMLYDQAYQMMGVGNLNGIPRDHRITIDIPASKLPKTSDFDAANSDNGPKHIYFGFFGDEQTNQPTIYYQWEYIWTDA